MTLAVAFLLGCAADVKNTATRIQERKAFLDLHEALTARLESLNSQAGLWATEAVSRGYADLLDDAVAAARVAVEERFYRHQALQLLDVGYRSIDNRRAVELTPLVSRYNDIVTMRSAVVDGAGLGRYAETVDALAELRRAKNGLQRDLLAFLASDDGRARLDSLVALAGGLPDPEGGPAVDIRSAQHGARAADEKASDMLAALPSGDADASAAVRVLLDQRLTASFNHIVDDLNAFKALDDAGRHEEAMVGFGSVLAQAQALAATLSSDSLVAVFALTEAPPPFTREDVARVVATADENRTVAQYNHAVDRYKWLYRAFRNGSVTPRQVLAGIDEVLGLPAVEGELENQLLLLRRSVLNALAE